jgi:selenium metabolism protein YedF
MGTGDDTLGEKLMGVYLDTLSNFANEVSHIILVNSGVKLACHGSDSIEQLKNLSGIGIKILSCGTCLDFFELKDRLETGSVSNMFEIIETMKNSSKVFSP